MGLSNLTKLGFGKETTWGDGAAPTCLIPVNPPSITVNYEQILDNSLRGIAAADFESYQGVGHIEGSLEGPFYPNEIGHMLLGIMGTGTYATGTVSTHTFSLSPTTPSYAIQDENGIQTYRYSGVKFGSFGLRFNSAEGMLTYTSSFMGKERTQPATGAIPADATSAPFLGWQSTCTVGSVTGFGKVTEGEINLTREVVLHYADSGSQAPAMMYVGPLEVTARATLYFDSQSDYDRYLEKTKEKFEMTWTYGTGTDERELTFTASKMDFGDGAAEIDRSGSSLTLAYTMRALYNTTDGGPCKWTLKNNRTGAY